MAPMRIDELGTLANIKPEKMIESASLVRKGKVASLSQELSDKMPQIWFHGPYFSYTYRDVDYSLRKFSEFKNQLGSTVCRYELSDHTGTHVDGLNHASFKHEIYGGVDIRDISAESGTSELGIETMPPVFTRGLLLDFAGFFGVDMLEPGYEIRVEDVKKLMKEFDISMKTGDGIFFHTGFGKLWAVDNEKYLGDSPGPGVEVAKWLGKSGASITGTDTSPFEVTNSSEMSTLFPCHQILIKESGMHLVENMRLQELASDGVTEFLFACAPLKLKGGAGSPVSPIGVY